MLHMPAISAYLFELDGVLTNTAATHAAAWKQTFDAFLLERSDQTGGSFRPFEHSADYLCYVDGKLREVRSFLAARGITLPDGSPDDPPTADTVYGRAASSPREAGAR